VLDSIGRHIPLPLPIPDWSKPIILFLLLVAGGLALRTRVTSLRVRRLQVHQQELAADLDSMQAALVPEIPPQLGQLTLSVAYRPADGPAAGGDFYDAFVLSRGRVAIILGDVSGHGRTALAHATHMHYTLRAYIEAGLGPRAALKLAGRVLGPAQDELFTTVAIAVYDSTTASLTYATAGHPPPLMLATAAPEPLEGWASPALGWGASAGRRQTTVPFPTGARACFFTDGLTEAQADGQLLGRGGLLEHFSQLGPEPSAGSLLDDAREYAEETRDDMAACIIEAGPGSTGSGTSIEELEVDMTQVAAGEVDRFLEDCRVSPLDVTLTVDRARALVRDFGVAVIRVELTPGYSVAVASPPPAVDLATPLSGRSARLPGASQPPRQDAPPVRTAVSTHA
jgi:hypothetical protein